MTDTLNQVLLIGKQIPQKLFGTAQCWLSKHWQGLNSWVKVFFTLSDRGTSAEVLVSSVFLHSVPESEVQDNEDFSRNLGRFLISLKLMLVSDREMEPKTAPALLISGIS